MTADDQGLLDTPARAQASPPGASAVAGAVAGDGEVGTALDVEQLRWALGRMHEIREFEIRAERLFHAGAVRGSTHLAIGQEACAVGARLGTADGDLVAPTYRGHHYALAWGIPLPAAFGELLGRSTGCNGGYGGSKHFSSFEHGVLPGNAIVAAALPIACGTALRAKLDGDSQVTVVPFGDGATNQAAFHEALNQAAVWDLPVVFLCENNLYSEMTPIERMVKVERLADRAAAYGLPGVVTDGMDVEAVADSVRSAAERARAGGGPTFIEAMTYRFCGHMPGDNEPYRTADEVDEWRQRDPLLVTRERLSAAGVPASDIDDIEARAQAAVAEAQTEAEQAPTPDPQDILVGTASWMELGR